MSFFYDLNKKLDSIRATPEVTHQQLNERDMGKHNNATTGFAALAKKTGGGEKGAKIAGAQLAKTLGKMHESHGMTEAGALDWKSMINANASVGELRDIFEKYNLPRSIADFLEYAKDARNLGQAMQYFDKKSLEDEDYGRRVDREYGGNVSSGYYQLQDLMSEQMEEGSPYKDYTPVDEPVAAPKSAASASKPPAKPKPTKAVDDEMTNEEYTEESALQAAFGKKKYGDQGMKALQKAGRNNASDTTMNNIRNRYDKYDESMGQADEGNAFSGAVVRAKRDGIQPGEKINVGGKEYPVKEAAKYRDPKYKDRLYTQNPPEDDADTSLDTYYNRVKPAGYQGAKRLKGGDEYSRTDPLTRGFGRSGTGSPVEKGPRKGLPKRDQITSLKGSIKDASGTHAKPNLPEAAAPLDFDKVLDAIAALYGDDMWENDAMQDLANDLAQAGPTDRELDFIIAKGKLPTRLKNIRFTNSDDVQFGHLDEKSGDPMTAKQKKFAALAKPFDKITFADRIAGAKKEVDEMLGQVAADAMKNALGGGGGRNAEMDEGHFDDTPTRRRSSSGGEIDTSKPGSTVHRAVKGNYSGAAHSGEERRANRQADADDEQGPRAGRRTVGAGKGTKIGAKINTGKSKLMTREGNQDPADQGEYDQEGDMAKDTIKTVVRHAQALEKILGDNDNLPEWVQSKLAKIESMMTAVDDYMQNQETDQDDEKMQEASNAYKQHHSSNAYTQTSGYPAFKKKKPASKEVAKVANTIKKGDAEDFASTKHKDLPEKAAKKNKEEEVDESTKAGKGGMSFGKGIYDSIDRAVERQINESMNISMNMSNDEHGGPRQTLTITATDEDASQLATLLKMAGMGVSTADGDYTALMPHSGEEVCAGCGMADCGCGDMEQMDETYGDNVVDMNSPNYPTNTELGSLKTALTGGGLNKEKNYYSSNGQTTVPVTAVHGQDDEFQESIQRMREIAGIKETPSIFFPDPKDTAKQLGISTTRLIDTPTPMSTSNNRSYNNTFLDPAQKAQNRLARQNESIFTDTANLWKSYKG